MTVTPTVGAIVSAELERFTAECPHERQSILDFALRVAAELEPGSRLIDVGAGNSPYRELFAHLRYESTDWQHSPHPGARAVDHVGPAHDLPVPGGEYDAVLCTQVLEHTPNPGEVIRELHRILRPGGRLYLTVPLAWELHELPFDFYRYTPHGLASLLAAAGFERLDIRPRNDCFETLAQLLQNAPTMVGSYPDGRDREREEAKAVLRAMAAKVESYVGLDSRWIFPLGYSAVATKPAAAGADTTSHRRRRRRPGDAGRAPGGEGRGRPRGRPRVRDAVLCVGSARRPAPAVELRRPLHRGRRRHARDLCAAHRPGRRRGPAGGARQDARTRFSAVAGHDRTAVLRTRRRAAAGRLRRRGAGGTAAVGGVRGAHVGTPGHARRGPSPRPRRARLIASIIIVTYGQRALTEQCLRSLERALGDRLGDSWEIVVVDNNSPDDSPAMLRGWSDRATVRLLSENRNFAGGCNLGASEARGEVLVFLNNDTEVPDGALETLAEQAREPGVGVAGCRLLFPDGTIQHAGVAFLHSPALRVPMPQHVFHHQDQSLALTGGGFEADCVTAACMAVRADAFVAVGGFDEGYVNGLEDVDLCLKLRVAGHGIVYRGDVTVIHHEGASRGRGEGLWATPEKLATMRNNDLRFVSRWGASLDQDDQLAADLWDGALEPQPPARIADPADLVLVGQPGGIGAAGDECRALLAALSACGRVPAALDAPAPLVVPRLAGPLAQLVAEARRRRPIPGADWVFVPSGAHDRVELVEPAIVRLGAPETALGPIEDARAIWASSPAVARALADHGLAADRIRFVPPPVLPATPGDGGEGVLAILPVHLPGLAATVLSALRFVAGRSAVRLLPTVWSRGLEQQIAERLPGAELLRPCSDEARFAVLAGAADVVVALDPCDRFERRALVAAGVGTEPVTGDPDGPAAAVLGDRVASGAPDAGALARALDASLEVALAPTFEAAAARRSRRAAVAGACGFEAFAAHLASLRTSPVIA